MKQVIYYEASNGEVFQREEDAKREEAILSVEELIRSAADYPLEINFSEYRNIAEWIIANMANIQSAINESAREKP